MKKMFLLAMTTAAAVSAQAYSGLVENLKNRAVTWQYEYETGKTNTCFVLGSPSDYSKDWWDHKKEAVYDGYTWYTHTTTIDGVETEVYENQGYFECNNDEAWSGYQLTNAMHVTKIRFWAGRDAGWSGRAGRSRGVKLQGANTADFSDAVTFYTIFEDDDTLNAGPIDIVVSNEFLNATYTYVRMLAPAGNYCGNVAEVEFYGVESLVKGLTGTAFASPADSNHTADLATDGDMTTCYRSAETGGYLGFDLGAVKRVGGLWFIPERGQAWRSAGGIIECSDTEDFTTTNKITQLSWDNPTEKVWTKVTFDEPVSTRYIRFRAGNTGRQCSLAEIEFFAPYETPTETPTLTASATEGEAAAVKLTWNAPVNAYTKIAFERATAPGGPYADAGTADVTTGTWSDPTSLGGITYYYKAKFIDEDPSGTTYTGATCEGHVSAKGMMQLDRDATGALRSGCTAIWYSYPWGGDTSHTAAALFDGDLTTYSDIDMDASEAAKQPAAGIDLGTPCVITSCAIYPRKDLVERLNNVLFCGYTGASDTTTYDWWQLANRTELTDRFAATAESNYVWYAKSTKTTAAMQCVYFINTWGWYYADAAEMKVFGYRVADVEGVLLAPLTTTCVWKQGDGLLTWEACQNAASYRLERKERATGTTDDWSAWTTVDTVTATTDATTYTYRDRSTSSKKDYVYRLVSVNGAEVAYSDEIAAPLTNHGQRALVIIIR